MVIECLREVVESKFLRKFPDSVICHHTLIGNHRDKIIPRRNRPLCSLQLCSVRVQRPQWLSHLFSANQPKINVVVISCHCLTFRINLKFSLDRVESCNQMIISGMLKRLRVELWDLKGFWAMSSKSWWVLEKIWTFSIKRAFKYQITHHRRATIVLLFYRSIRLCRKNSRLLWRTKTFGHRTCKFREVISL